MSPRSILELSRAELAAWCEEQGERPFRADQLRRWVFGKRVERFAEMHDLPAGLRSTLDAEFSLFSSKVVRHRIASDGTEKLLLELHDGHTVECVLMREPGHADAASSGKGLPQQQASATNRPRRTGMRRRDADASSSTGKSLPQKEASATNRPRRTVCISTQVGCAMGCVFCASGLLGLTRNLSSGEILEQVLRIDRLLGENERITNIVVMGIGEPLANLKGLLPALATLNETGGVGLGARRITISTVGLPEKIRELAEVGKPYNLAVSLHAPNDEMRNRLVPVSGRIGIAAILEAADDYFARTGRRVTYEYVLLGGVNDGAAEARQLAQRLRSRCAHVNLIPMNAVHEMPFRAPTPARLAEFVRILQAAGIPATVRKRKGADIDAACGQLRLVESRESSV